MKKFKDYEWHYLLRTGFEFQLCQWSKSGKVPESANNSPFSCVK